MNFQKFQFNRSSFDLPNINLLCFLKGEIFSETTSQNTILCDLNCKKTSNCKWYSFDATTSRCFLYPTCPELDETKTDWISNELGCSNLLKSKSNNID